MRFLRTPEDVRRFFDANVAKRGVNECWPWNGPRDKPGYGFFWGIKKKQRAHWLAYGYARGIVYEARPGRVMRHLCGNANCCNPAHLRVGTQRQNAIDMVQHGRSHLARLDELTVLQLRERHSQERMSYAALARELGFTRQGVRAMIRGKTWKHVPKVSRRKLTDETVREMRTLAAQGQTAESLAARFGVHVRTANQAIRGETWQHIGTNKTRRGA